MKKSLFLVIAALALFSLTGCFELRVSDNVHHSNSFSKHTALQSLGGQQVEYFSVEISDFHDEALVSCDYYAGYYVPHFWDRDDVIHFLEQQKADCLRSNPIDASYYHHIASHHHHDYQINYVVELASGETIRLEEHYPEHRATMILETSLGYHQDSYWF